MTCSETGSCSSAGPPERTQAGCCESCTQAPFRKTPSTATFRPSGTCDQGQSWCGPLAWRAVRSGMPITWVSKQHSVRSQSCVCWEPSPPPPSGSLVENTILLVTIWTVLRDSVWSNWIEGIYGGWPFLAMSSRVRYSSCTTGETVAKVSVMVSTTYLKTLRLSSRASPCTTRNHYPTLSTYWCIWYW